MKVENVLHEWIAVININLLQDNTARMVPFGYLCLFCLFLRLRQPFHLAFLTFVGSCTWRTRVRLKRPCRVWTEWWSKDATSRHCSYKTFSLRHWLPGQINWVFDIGIAESLYPSIIFAKHLSTWKILHFRFGWKGWQGQTLQLDGSAQWRRRMFL